MQKPKYFNMSGLTKKEITETMWLSKYEVCNHFKCSGRKVDYMSANGEIPIPYMDESGRLYWRESQILEALAKRTNA